MDPWMPYRGAALAVVAVLALTACTKSGSDGRTGELTAPSPSVSAVPSLDAVDSLTLPIEAYLFTAAQTRVLNDAHRSLVNDCMTRFGFSTEFVPPTAGVAPPNQLTRRYGVTDQVSAARYGYHLTPEDGIPTAGKPQTGGRAYTKAELLVLTGNESGTPVAPNQSPAGGKSHNGKAVPPGGCTGEAKAKLGFDKLERADAARLPDQINFSTYQQASSDSRVVAVLKQWSACMKAKGYTYGTPTQAMEAADIKQASPTDAEIRTAIADVTCKKEHNVVGVWYGIESAYQKTVIQQNIEKLTSIKKEQGAALKLAAREAGVPVPN